jgi:hypothetical protein
VRKAKYVYLSSFLGLLGLILVACYQSITPTVDIDAMVQEAVDATLAAQPTDAPPPDLDATVQVAVQATLTAQPASASEPSSAGLAEASDRPYRVYPRPTGQAGFRRYYQKRCYPGCHVPADVGTPTPVHP